MKMNTKLEKYIATRDKRMNNPVTATPLLEKFNDLVKRGEVEVGGRASCGGATDPTWLFFTAWNEIVRKASDSNYSIEITPIKHANKSPTMAGGFWQSNIYKLVSVEPNP